MGAPEASSPQLNWQVGCRGTCGPLSCPLTNKYMTIVAAAVGQASVHVYVVVLKVADLLRRQMTSMKPLVRIRFYVLLLLLLFVCFLLLLFFGWPALTSYSKGLGGLSSKDKKESALHRFDIACPPFCMLRAC